VEQEQQLTGAPEEWLRRIAVSQSLAIVPGPTAFVLVAAGLAERDHGGSLVMTAAGRVYLDARGIACQPRDRCT
jgi:threonine/homoserine/homoserine lactone efflux protein